MMKMLFTCGRVTAPTVARFVSQTALPRVPATRRPGARSGVHDAEEPRPAIPWAATQPSGIGWTSSTPRRLPATADWRIPTVSEGGGRAELETMYGGKCGFGMPCVPSAFNTDCTSGCTVADCSCTQNDNYRSATSGGNPSYAYFVCSSGGIGA